MSGGDHRQCNGILGGLIRLHYPGLVTHAQVESPPWTWDHFNSAVDAVYGTVQERIRREFWVSLHHTTLLNTMNSLDVLEIMKGHMMSVCRTSSCWRRGMTPPG